ncbi:Tigger transposable element-derived protein 6-like [Oopsacas minuta]|uniref:Tigger transposable element-derived protein 6-like n=1 Tax=Oopsacas minuta TaxID=111878 RepID=A0AAV7JF18_9METZ|nr:Tigger transposable element-derived protein 6-like [Oopsacas minuta]
MKQGKRQRSGKDPEVEEALNKWFKPVLDKGVRISGVILRSKAEEFAVRLGKPGFVATEGWLYRWKARHQIKAKRIHGEKSSADFEGAEFWVSTVLPQLLLEYTPENI